MLNIELAKLAVLAVILYIQMEGSFGNLEDERDMWSVENWQEDPSDTGFAIRIADLMKRSKSHQFHGLMGRSSDVQPVRLGRKRNKGEMFVGLMGRRSSSGEVQSREWEKPPNYY